MAAKTPEMVLYVFVVVAIAFAVANVALIANRSGQVSEASRLAAAAGAPAQLELITIAASSCQECFAVDAVADALKKANVNITSERVVDASSAEGVRLVAQYRIEKLPTLVVRGEINGSAASLWNQNWRVEPGEMPAAVYVAVNPPYVDAGGRVVGMVSLTHIIDESCADCADLGQVVTFFEQQGVLFSEKRTVDYRSADGEALIARFGVRDVPAIIVSNDILAYPAIAQVWTQLNASEKDGFYAVHTTVPPYRDLATDTIVGRVSVVYLNDSACARCYDVRYNTQILERTFGMTVANETVVDVNSARGKALIQQYTLTAAPIILVSPDAAAYAGFVQAWPQVGDRANDGWFVMRQPDALGSYRDLATGTVIHQVTIYGSEFTFEPNAIEVAKGETVNITFVNAGSGEHDLIVEAFGVATRRLQPQTAETITFVANEAGTFPFFCSVDGHREQGMEGTIVVR